MKRFYLEITNSCNLSCYFCTNPKGNRFLSIEDFISYVRQIREFGSYLYLHVLGEPLLHPDIQRFLDILDEEEMHLQLVTNGTLLNRYPDILSHRCMRKLSISLHSVSGTSIENDYFKTIHTLIENNRNTCIELRFYDEANLDQQLHSFLNSLKEEYGLQNSERKNSYRLKEGVYIAKGDLFDWPSLNDKEQGDTGRCHGLKDQIAILSEGTVTSCCLDPLGINAFGSLKKQTLKEILNGDLYKEALYALNDHKLILPLCRHCSYRCRFDHKPDEKR